MFQSFNLFPQYTALKNVTLARELLAQEQPDFKQNKKKILEDILPTHLDIQYVFWYITWAMMEERFDTWGDIEAISPTWEELEKMVKEDEDA